MTGQLYIIEGHKGKTHLAYIEEFSGAFVLYCCSVHVVNTCNCESPCPEKHDPDCGYPAGREEAEEWDTLYSEVNCPTCLRKALGKGTAIPMEVPCR